MIEWVWLVVTMGATPMNEDFLQEVKTFFEQDYRERGKVKWQGFFLSDHTQKMKAQKQARAHPKHLTTPMPLATIQERVQLAWHLHRTLEVQVNSRDLDGHLVPIQAGLVSGFWDQGFILKRQPYDWADILAVAEVAHGH